MNTNKIKESWVTRRRRKCFYTWYYAQSEQMGE